MRNRYKVYGTCDTGECEVDTGYSQDQAVQWADRFKRDGKENVVVKEISDDSGQPSTWYAW